MPAWRSSRYEFLTQWKASIVANVAAVWCRSGVGIGPPPLDAPWSGDARSRFWTLKPSGERSPGLGTEFSPSPVGMPPVSPVETAVILGAYHATKRPHIVVHITSKKVDLTFLSQ